MPRRNLLQNYNFSVRIIQIAIEITHYLIESTTSRYSYHHMWLRLLVQEPVVTVTLYVFQLWIVIFHESCTQKLEKVTHLLAFAIKRYFEINQEAIEVLIFKGGMSTGLSSPICCFNDATLCNDIAVLFMIVEKFCINSLWLVNMERIEYLHILFLQGSDANT